MSDNTHDAVRRKVMAIFSELTGGSEVPLGFSNHYGQVRSAIASAVSSALRDEVADEIAFHMLDWNHDAAFIVALQLFPERFTPEEIEAGIGLFLVHAPAHILAAARLMGYSMEDIFDEGDTC